MARLSSVLALLLSFPCAHPRPIPLAVKPTPYMPVASVWLGATLYGTGKPVTVHFIRSTSDWGHELAFMDSRAGAARPLMLYRSTGHERLCPDSGGLKAELGPRDSSEEIVFRLRTLVAQYAGKFCTGEACGPRYTGMNNVFSHYHSAGEYAHLMGLIWAQMARIPAAVADSLPPPCPGASRLPPGEGGVLVSFNDGFDDGFGDMVILVTGVDMDVERPALVPENPPLPIPKALSSCQVEAAAGGVAEGEAFAPRAMALPLSAIAPRASGREPRFFIDQEWRLRYPGRPDETAFPNGPEIRVAAPGPFRFDLAFFTNHGEFVNRARGEVTAGMLRLAPTLPDGRRQVSLLWYPVSEGGERISTGAYVVKGWIKSAPASSPACGESRASLLSTFGYIRN